MRCNDGGAVLLLQPLDEDIHVQHPQKADAPALAQSIAVTEEIDETSATHSYNTLRPPRATQPDKTQPAPDLVSFWMVTLLSFSVRRSIDSASLSCSDVSDGKIPANSCVCARCGQAPGRVQSSTVQHVPATAHLGSAHTIDLAG